MLPTLSLCADLVKGSKDVTWVTCRLTCGNTSCGKDLEIEPLTAPRTQRNVCHMTNNTAPAHTTDEIARMKRDDLRKYAAQIGIKSASKHSRDALTQLVIARVTDMIAQNESASAPVEPTPVEPDDTNVARVRTSHADCTHASTKVARANCRRERARTQN